jgi:hypothetical protein
LWLEKQTISQVYLLGSEKKNRERESNGNSRFYSNNNKHDILGYLVLMESAGEKESKYITLSAATVLRIIFFFD